MGGRHRKLTGCLFMGQNKMNVKRQTGKEPEKYQNLVGGMRYLSDFTRPDLAFIVGNLKAGNATPRALHWDMFKATMRYMRNTNNYGMLYEPHRFAQCNSVDLYSDASFAGDGVNRKSTTGILITYKKHSIHCK